MRCRPDPRRLGRCVALCVPENPRWVLSSSPSAQGFAPKERRDRLGSRGGEVDGMVKQDRSVALAYALSPTSLLACARLTHWCGQEIPKAELCLPLRMHTCANCTPQRRLCPARTRWRNGKGGDLVWFVRAQANTQLKIRHSEKKARPCPSLHARAWVCKPAAGPRWRNRQGGMLVGDTDKKGKWGAPADHL
jgi:hypothetical protein